MADIAFIGGSSLFKSDILVGKNTEIFKSSAGSCLLFHGTDTCFVQRHGENNVPPHKINHEANLTALKQLGFTTVIALNSVGSLKKELGPGTICLADDFISFYQIPSINTMQRIHVTPILSESLNIKIDSSLDTTLDKIIYWQTTGPRFETPAEIRMMSQFADVVGMTMGSEATIAAELDMEYASICVIDNYCNGIADNPLSFVEFEEMVEENQNTVDQIIRRLITCLC